MRKTRDCLQQRWTIFFAPQPPPTPLISQNLFRRFSLHPPSSLGCKHRYPKTPVPKFHAIPKSISRLSGSLKNVSLPQNKQGGGWRGGLLKLYLHTTKRAGRIF
ncbi:hypothetical protein CEXT_627751 [Caerostris extrusa]|uniref:Uncharacterized protein n=1 Tax=Caerostris extrusa TaxID=172846 RepID=A0AAV4XSU1_CAEEX|nr:hypothetical protein CEXT_627751 [Caerostris extrusa]